MKTPDQFPNDALLRMVIVSRAHFSNWADPRGVELEISRIMYPSPRIDADDQCGGIFHHRNHWFLQCLEGPAEAVRQFWQRHLNDPRHRDSQPRLLERIDERIFTPGGMRYAGFRRELAEVRARNGLEGIELFDLEPEHLRELLVEYRAARAKRGQARQSG